MNTFRAGCTVLVTLVLGTACSENPVSQRLNEPGPAAGVALSQEVSQDAAGGRYIAVLDDCDPADPGWASVGGCLLKRGRVTFAEFVAEVNPVVRDGHASWRNEPSYLRSAAGKSVRVKNEGGRGHTFTRVAAFGGGVVPPLSFGLPAPPECATLITLAPGETQEITGLAPGLHRFQCCFHPWMRAHIAVESHH